MDKLSTRSESKNDVSSLYQRLWLYRRAYYFKFCFPYFMTILRWLFVILSYTNLVFIFLVYYEPKRSIYAVCTYDIPSYICKYTSGIVVYNLLIQFQIPYNGHQYMWKNCTYIFLGWTQFKIRLPTLNKFSKYLLKDCKKKKIKKYNIP